METIERDWPSCPTILVKRWRCYSLTQNRIIENMYSDICLFKVP